MGIEVWTTQTTSCKIVEALDEKKDLCCFKSLLPFSLRFKVVPPSFEHGPVLLATFIRGGRGSQAQNHGQVIYAKIRYSVSSTFATGCSGHQGENERQRKKKVNRKTYNRASIKRVTKKFLEVSGGSRARQRQRIMYNKVCSTSKVVFSPNYWQTDF